MKGYRFYAEMPADRGSKSGSKKWEPFTKAFLAWLAKDNFHNNCIAVPLDEKGQPMWCGNTFKMDAYVTDTDRSNSWPMGGVVERDYLRERCVRIDAALARKLHPKLFTYLERP